MRAIGRWMKVNGESIYGTVASPFEKLEWGRCTQKQWRGGTRLYLHVFTWPQDGKLLVPGLRTLPAKCILLASGKRVTASLTPGGIELSLPSQTPDPFASVIVLESKGKAEVLP